MIRKKIHSMNDYFPNKFYKNGVKEYIALMYDDGDYSLEPLSFLGSLHDASVDVLNSDSCIGVFVCKKRFSYEEEKACYEVIKENVGINFIKILAENYFKAEFIPSLRN